MSAYQRLVASPGKRRIDCEKGAISALQIERFDDGKPLVECAVAPATASWRAWNARGVLADSQHAWATADDSYQRALKLAPNEARVINNQGWSMLLRGDWAAAVPLFQKAVALDKDSERIANNLELAKTALAADLPRRRPGEANEDWAARLNDAGVAAELLGDNHRAVAAFTQALDASPVWYDRASNNLKALSQN
jgi:tetratricopeptide (TPR) repeat protein